MSSQNEGRIAKRIPVQVSLPVVHSEVDGIGMGVLSDGTPYLSSQGLSRLCGVAPSVIIELTSNWSEHSTKPRGLKLRELLHFHGHPGDTLAIETIIDGKPTNAHPDSVCMAILEYYGYEKDREFARRAHRVLARKGLRDFIYERLGYADPTQRAWENFHDLVSMNLAPKGYFSVFQECASMIVTAIRNGLQLGPHTVPDISVGKFWSKHWESCGLSAVHGERRRHEHRYPDHYPQSKAFPEAWVYPIAALGDFRTWHQDVYLPQKYPPYLKGKVTKGQLSSNEYDQLIEATLKELAYDMDND